MKSTVGFVLTLIGGIFSILGALSLLSFASILSSLIPGFLGKLGFIFPLVVLAVGIVSIWASTKMNKDDDKEVKKAGIIALICGIIGFNILIIIGAIIALVQSGK